MSNDIKKILNEKAWLIDGQIIKENQLTANEIRELELKCTGTIQPIYSDNKKEIIGVLM